MKETRTSVWSLCMRVKGFGCGCFCGFAIACMRSRIDLCVRVGGIHAHMPVSCAKDQLTLFTTATKGDLILFTTEQGDHAHTTSARVNKITEKAGPSPFQAHCTRAGKFGCCRYTRHCRLLTFASDLRITIPATSCIFPPFSHTLDLLENRL
jgi:hypothetical protein